MKRASKKRIVVCVSGGFDPVHVGHARMLEEAKKHGDKLVVILNNDNWLVAKKGFAFMPARERKELLESLRSVDKVVLTGHRKGTKDMSIRDELRKLKPDIFANGGDRKPSGDPVPEVALCKELGIRMVYNVGRGGKVQSSSWLLKKHFKRQGDSGNEKPFVPKKGQVDYSTARFAPVINCILHHKGKILLIYRSPSLRFYPGCWNGVSGFLDDGKDIEEKAKEEIREETGIAAKHIKTMERGQTFEVEDPRYKKTWIVHPVRVEVDTNKVRLDWEGATFRWVSPREARKLSLVSGVTEVLDNLGL